MPTRSPPVSRPWRDSTAASSTVASDSLGYQITALVLIVTALAVVVAAWGSMRGGFIDHIAYIVGVGLYFSNLARHLDRYNNLYVEIGAGTVSAEAMVLVFYVLLPGAITLIPLLSLPFIDLLYGWEDAEDYEDA